MVTDKQLKTKQNKIDTCEKYKEYITLIYELGNKIMFQFQLKELLEIFEFETNKTRFADALKELERMDIIKKINYMNTGYKVIMLRNFGIRFMEGTVKNSRATPSLPKANSSKIFKERLLKCAYKIKRFKLLKRKKNLIGWELYNFYKRISKKNCTTIELNCFQGPEFIKLNNLEDKILNKENIRKAYFEELEIINKLKSNLKKTNIQEKNNNDIKNDVTFLKFKKQQIDIRSIFKQNNKYVVYIYYWNFENSCSIRFVERMLKVVLYLKNFFIPNIANNMEFNLVCISSDDEISNAIKKNLFDERIIDTGKKKIKQSRIINILRGEKFGSIGHQITIGFLTYQTI